MLSLTTATNFLLRSMSNTNTMKIHIVLFAFCLPYVIGFPAVNDEQKRAKIDEFMNGILQCRQTPGWSIAIVQNGSVFLTKGYGLADVEDEVPVTDTTLFAIASITKSFTTTMMSKIFSESETADWDTPIRDVLGDSFHFQNGYRTNVTNSRDLAAHRTGIPRYDPLTAMNLTESNDDLIGRVRLMEPAAKLREGYLYNNNMYGLLQKVAELLTGTNRREYLREELFRPLRMLDTTFYDNVVNNNFQGAAKGYNVDQFGNWSIMDLVPLASHRVASQGISHSGAGGDVFASAADMAKWMLFVLSGGYTQDGVGLVDEEYMEMLQEPHTALPLSAENQNAKPNVPVSDTAVSYSLGYNNAYYRGFRHFSHSGRFFGYNSEITFLKSHDLGIYMANNLANVTRENRFLHDFLIDIMLGEEPWLDAAKFCDYMDNTLYQLNQRTDPLNSYHMDLCPPLPALSTVSEANTLHSDNNDQYIGLYGNFVFGNVTISWNPELDSLLFELGPTTKYTLEQVEDPEEEHYFLGRYANEESYAQYTTIAMYFSDLEDGLFQTLTVPVLEMNAFPIFIRGLIMSEKPEPNTNCL